VTREPRTQPHPPTTTRAPSDRTTHRQTPQEYRTRVVRATTRELRVLPPCLPLNKPPKRLGRRGLTQHDRASQTMNKALPQRGLMLPYLPHNAGRRRTSSSKIPGPRASALGRARRLDNADPIGRRRATPKAQGLRIGYVVCADHRDYFISLYVDSVTQNSSEGRVPQNGSDSPRFRVCFLLYPLSFFFISSARHA
jgi:hypothetical protein